MSPILYAIVPLLDEEPNVDALVGSLASLRRGVVGDLSLVVLFVDDGSRDGTVAGLLRHSGDMPFEVLRHDTNRGPGAAFATGFSWLHGRLAPGDWVLTMEGDATSPTGVIQQMLTRRGEGYDVVLGSPYVYGGGFSRTSAHRVFVSQAANGLVKLFLGISGLQTFSGFLRLYRGECVAALQERFGPGIVETVGFESMVELLGKIVAMGFSVTEVPLRVDGSLRRGPSKMKVAKTTVGYCRLFWRWRALSRPAPGG